MFAKDNYYSELPARMEDGRFFTDYRAPQVREKVFKCVNGIATENNAREFRINNAEKIMDSEWLNLIAHDCDYRSNKKCKTNPLASSCTTKPHNAYYHTNPTTLTSTIYNNAELLAYNGAIWPPKYNRGCHDYRLTETKMEKNGRPQCQEKKIPLCGYSATRCPGRCRDGGVEVDMLRVQPN